MMKSRLSSEESSSDEAQVQSKDINFKQTIPVQGQLPASPRFKGKSLKTRASHHS
jgi:hypothetical protein